MDSHFEKFKVFHAQLTVEVLVEAKMAVPRLSKELKELEETVCNVESKISSINELSTKMDEKCDHLEKKRDILLERYDTSTS